MWKYHSAYKVKVEEK